MARKKNIVSTGGRMKFREGDEVRDGEGRKGVVDEVLYSRDRVGVTFTDGSSCWFTTAGRYEGDDARPEKDLVLVKQAPKNARKIDLCVGDLVLTRSGNHGKVTERSSWQYEVEFGDKTWSYPRGGGSRQRANDIVMIQRRDDTIFDVGERVFCKTREYGTVTKVEKNVIYVKHDKLPYEFEYTWAGKVSSSEACPDTDLELDMTDYQETTDSMKENDMRLATNPSTVQGPTGFMSRLMAVGGSVLSFMKALLSGDFEEVGRVINMAKHYAKTNTITRTFRYVLAKGRLILHNPRRWLLAAIGVGAFGDEVMTLLGNLFVYGMKVIKEWLPAPIYAMLESKIAQAMRLAQKVIDILINNKPVKFLRRILGVVFGKALEMFKTVKTYIKKKLTEMMVRKMVEV